MISISDILLDYLIYGFISAFIYCCMCNFNNPLFLRYNLLSKELYNETEMNIIGCVICAVLIHILCPLIYGISTLVKIIYWLFHIGRKENI